MKYGLYQLFSTGVLNSVPDFVGSLEECVNVQSARYQGVWFIGPIV